jgi:hypothetical protein
VTAEPRQNAEGAGPSVSEGAERPEGVLRAGPADVL